MLVLHPVPPTTNCKVHLTKCSVGQVRGLNIRLLDHLQFPTLLPSFSVWVPYGSPSWRRWVWLLWGMKRCRCRLLQQNSILQQNFGTRRGSPPGSGFRLAASVRARLSKFKIVFLLSALTDFNGIASPGNCGDLPLQTDQFPRFLPELGWSIGLPELSTEELFSGTIGHRKPRNFGKSISLCEF